MYLYRSFRTPLSLLSHIFCPDLLKAAFSCSGTGFTFCTSKSLNMACMSVSYFERSAFISVELCFNLLVHPFFTCCLSASHFEASIR
ncbi:hypothetical protein Barb7_02801 [Bacteroidales bacterium Barb7]|nr:hypothetical protein Barb7_02801 [Bacteroidales bacterium Barb7]